MICQRITREQYRKLCAAAKRAGLSVYEYVKRKIES